METKDSSVSKGRPKIINHLLLIDDDPLTEVLLDGVGGNLHLINRYVFKAGGRQALEYLTYSQKSFDFPDLIILDLNMPEMDGYEFLENYERTYFLSFPNSKIVIATSAVTEQENVLMKNFPSVKMLIFKPIVKERFIEIHNKLFS